MSRLASLASAADQHRWTLPSVRFARSGHTGTRGRHATSLSPHRVAAKAGQVAAYTISGIVYLGVLVAVFWV